ncbi:MAG TPA: Smr/MutS family protein [Acidisoma sp.]|uniref:Smr/MutS family protein n=1 Tax=Acidisoma sp. TaxID=1872115 RepID=UPI002B9978B2|nr:Smr/MutS family protein [Acidisoma sp.]HTI03244.1 Smr/MutS family protein [Acidisoma sp.]
MPSRRLSDRERAEWLRFAQSIGARPLQATEAEAMALATLPAPAPAGATEPDAAPPQAQVVVLSAVRLAPKPRPAEIAVGQAAAGLDAASWEKLRRGRMRPERKLDLHGRTAQAAYAAFERFIAQARADGVRCVEVVTGRGAGEGGVLKRELPHWLNLPHIRGGILAAAHPHRANVGAVLLLLRRNR